MQVFELRNSYGGDAPGRAPGDGEALFERCSIKKHLMGQVVVFLSECCSTLRGRFSGAPNVDWPHSPLQLVAPVIIMYPKASVLYSINTKRVMTETGIQQWLEAIVASRCFFSLH